ncbi:cytochrome c oxidase accessory protein CcoG [Membranihabitans maritimus]|uniref:cytochrome c oxidase accessory protein CcoG n=1 Tax=Membranihabitans maritimus TaxID=2904244 RepID=UPI001EFF8812|nr:cytochrome c oxidase accessory protein CcoG [Membranihabitans maritimus]
MEKMTGNDDFRDHLSNVDSSGRRVWMYPLKPQGLYTKYRKYVSVFLLAFLILTPFIKINGRPLLMFNILEGKFIIFGSIFWPQDFIVFGIAMMIGILFIALFTMVYGRVFCGWVCPQTIFMEMVFRRIEYWIEGSHTKQKLLNKRPWDRDKLYKKTLKHTIFLLISFGIANIFLSYIIGVDALWEIITDPVSQHLGGFVAILIFTLAFYGVFAFVREIVCTNICPYGRLQGVLLDSDSVVVAYDHQRGEPRGKFKKGQEREIGDCIDCGQCVQVCPTGIDIRHGTQLECVNCTACIDACDNIMDKVGLPRGLIRYDSENAISRNEKWHFTTRTKVYSFILVALIFVEGGLLLNRSNVSATVTRVAGQLYQVRDDDSVSNLYNIKLVNKTFDDIDNIILEPLNLDGDIEVVGNKKLNLPAEGITEGTFFLIVGNESVKPGKNKLEFKIVSGGEVLTKVSTSFFSPN